MMRANPAPRRTLSTRRRLAWMTQIMGILLPRRRAERRTGFDRRWRLASINLHDLRGPSWQDS
jgi:hypothetical protein